MFKLCKCFQEAWYFPKSDKVNRKEGSSNINFMDYSCCFIAIDYISSSLGVLLPQLWSLGRCVLSYFKPGLQECALKKQMSSLS